MSDGQPVTRAKVLIVDDHPAVREALAVRIARQPDLEVCGEAADVGEALVAAILGKVDAIEVGGRPRKQPLLPWVYRLWNAGFLVPLVGGSGKDSNRVPLGRPRTYARLGPDDAVLTGVLAAEVAGDGPGHVRVVVDGDDRGPRVVGGRVGRAQGHECSVKSSGPGGGPGAAGTRSGRMQPIVGSRWAECPPVISASRVTGLVTGGTGLPRKGPGRWRGCGRRNPPA